MHKGEMRGSEGCYYLYDGRKKLVKEGAAGGGGHWIHDKKWFSDYFGIFIFL